MAEFVARHLARRAGLADAFEFASAATSREEEGNPVYPPARAELARHGIGCEGKVARTLQRADYGRYDLIVGMDEANLRNMRVLFGGDPEGKLSLLLDHTPAADAGHHGRSVADPWYTGRFDVAWDDISRGCEALLKKLAEDV